MKDFNKKIEYVKPGMKRLIMLEQDYIRENKTQLDKIIKGWYPPGIEHKKRQLAKLGIRTLQRTPGSLITKKGHIDGYLSAFGEVTGKISFTPDQAEKAMGFRPKEGAIGVLLSRRRYVDENGKVKSGIFASSLMPHAITPTEKMKGVWERGRVVGKMVSRHMHDLIYPIWEPLVTDKSRKPWSGAHYFESLNLKNIGSSLDWSKLLISNGKLPPPKQVCPNWYDPEKKQIQIILPRTIGSKLITINNQIGLGVLDIRTGDFFHIAPEQITKQVEQRISSSEFTPKQLKQTRTNLNFKPLEFTWKIEQIRKNYRLPQVHSQKWFSSFYLYIYYKRQMSEVRTQKLEVRSEKPITPSFHHSITPSPSSHPSSFIPHNSQYSPSISSRIKVCKNRTEGKNRILIVISVQERE